MRGFLVFLGLLLMLGGGAMAGAQYANVDLSALDVAAGTKAFLLSPDALYAGSAVAGLGLVLIIAVAATGWKKRKQPARTKASEWTADAGKPATAQSLFDPEPAQLSLAPEPQRTVAHAVHQPSPVPVAPRAVVTAPDQPPWSQPATPPAAKPTASAQPPEGYDPLLASRTDPRLVNRKRVTDLVSINDALKAYHARHGAYPKAEGLLGADERGETWIPGLAPEFIARLPLDPAAAGGQTGPQYVYVSDGVNYKLLAQGVSLIGGTNVEVLGVRIDPTRRPTAENASFGFWTPEFASA